MTYTWDNTEVTRGMTCELIRGVTRGLFTGDLLNEDEVLKWLLEQKVSSTIEEVTDEILKKLIEHHEYVVVYFSESQS